MRILQVSTRATLGGAERIALDLHRTYLAHGLPAWLAVGEKRGDLPQVLALDNDAERSRWARTWVRLGAALTPLIGRIPGIARVQRLITLGIGQPGRYRDYCRGYEDLDFPATWRLLDLPPERPQILHAHNLHGGYFDLRALPMLSHQVPTLLTLHDAWLFSGHCAHSLGCERWQVGCGACPDLSIYPAVRRDATDANWARKREIYQRCRLYIATPCDWLKHKVQASILAPAIRAMRVIPNSVDLETFAPGAQAVARRDLNLPPQATIMLFASNGIRRNVFKDYQTLRAAMHLLARQFSSRPLLFIALGEAAPPERIGCAEVRFVPFQNDPRRVAQYYRAADIYLHAARAEVWGLTITEALACGTPVVATAVGGIPEQVQDGLTGYLVAAGDAQALAARAGQLIQDSPLRQTMSARAVEMARQRFSLGRMAAGYLAFYQQMLADWSERS